MPNNTGRCGTCQYWRGPTRVYDGNWGHCKFYPAVLHSNGTSSSPMAVELERNERDWCGQHKVRQYTPLDWHEDQVSALNTAKHYSSLWKKLDDEKEHHALRMAKDWLQRIDEALNKIDKRSEEI